MLDLWRELGVLAVGVGGIKPSINFSDISLARGHEVVSEFMSERVADNILARGKVSLVFGANVSCHIADIEGYFKRIAALIGKTGVIVFEDPYFLDIVAKTSYDQVYYANV